MKQLLIVLPVVLVLLGVQLAYASSDPIVFLSATVSPDNSNQFIHNQFKVDTFTFRTSDAMICPSGLSSSVNIFLRGCTYTLDNGDWRTNTFNSNMFVFEGNLKATSGSASNFYSIRADLTRNSENTASGHDVTTLTGTLSFGNGVPDYSVLYATFDSTNSTLKLLGLTTGG